MESPPPRADTRAARSRGGTPTVPVLAVTPAARRPFARGNAFPRFLASSGSDSRTSARCRRSGNSPGKECSVGTSQCCGFRCWQCYPWRPRHIFLPGAAVRRRARHPGGGPWGGICGNRGSGATETMRCMMLQRPGRQRPLGSSRSSRRISVPRLAGNAAAPGLARLPEAARRAARRKTRRCRQTGRFPARARWASPCAPFRRGNGRRARTAARRDNGGRRNGNRSFSTLACASRPRRFRAQVARDSGMSSAVDAVADQEFLAARETLRRRRQSEKEAVAGFQRRTRLARTAVHRRLRPPASTPDAGFMRRTRPGAPARGLRPLDPRR